MSEQVDEPVIGATYRHFKGGLYTVLLFATDAWTPYETMVVYRTEYDGSLWVRARKEFMERVSVGDFEVERFQREGTA